MVNIKNNNLVTLSDEELRDIVLRKQLQYIKLCQDDFLTFVQEVWPDFIFRKTGSSKRSFTV